MEQLEEIQEVGTGWPGLGFQEAFWIRKEKAKTEPLWSIKYPLT